MCYNYIILLLNKYEQLQLHKYFLPDEIYNYNSLLLIYIKILSRSKNNLFFTFSLTNKILLLYSS